MAEESTQGPKFLVRRPIRTERVSKYPKVLDSIPEIASTQTSDSDRMSPTDLLVPIRAPDGRQLQIIPSMIPELSELNEPRHALTCGERVIHGLVQAFLAVSQQWITHFLMVLALVGYTALGGAMFHYVEGPHEYHIKRNLDDSRFKLGHKLWLSCSKLDEAKWHKSFHEEIRGYEKEIVASPTAIERDVKWGYVGAMFFSGTVYSTIGYGNVVPNTDYGRGLTVIYAFFGIPLTLIILADLGRMFTKAIKYVWSFIRRFYYTGHFTQIKTIAPAMGKFIPGQAEPEPYAVDDNFDLPVSVALLLLLAYILLGGLMMVQWETNWSYFHAIYFIFVSLTTIGFGDMTPDNPTYLIITFVYLMFGLALMSMCINVVQVTITNTFYKAKRKIARIQTTSLSVVHGSYQASREPSLQRIK